MIVAPIATRAQEEPNPALQLALFSRPPNSTTTADGSSSNAYSTTPGTFRHNFCALNDRVQVYKNLTLEAALQGIALHVVLMQGDFVKLNPEEDIFGVQIASGYPDQFTRVAEVIEQHLEVDFVDVDLRIIGKWSVMLFVEQS